MKNARALTMMTLSTLLALGAVACSSADPQASGGTPAAPARSGVGSSPGSSRQAYVEVSPSAASGGAAQPEKPSFTAGSTPRPAASAGELRYTNIAEPFSELGDCDENGTTLQMTACVLQQVVDVDSTIDAAQLTAFELTPASKQAALLAEYARWLDRRGKTCATQAKSGGSIDRISTAQCLLRVSRQRADALNSGS